LAVAHPGVAVSTRLVNALYALAALALVAELVWVSWMGRDVAMMTSAETGAG